MSAACGNQHQEGAGAEAVAGAEGRRGRSDAVAVAVTTRRKLQHQQTATTAERARLYRTMFNTICIVVAILEIIEPGVRKKAR